MGFGRTCYSLDTLSLIAKAFFDYFATLNNQFLLAFVFPQFSVNFIAIVYVFVFSVHDKKFLKFATVHVFVITMVVPLILFFLFLILQFLISSCLFQLLFHPTLEMSSSPFVFYIKNISLLAITGLVWCG